MAETPHKLVLPSKLQVAAMDDAKGVLRPWAEIEREFVAGDPDIRNSSSLQVTRTSVIG